jgi:hypothetical protein
MRMTTLALLAGTLLSACATTRMSDQQRLALYSSHAGPPVRTIVYRQPIGWERIDGSHALLTMRPTEAWLLQLPPDCFNWIGAGPTVAISHHAGFVSARFDRISGDSGGTQMDCLIQEIRPVDIAGVRAARDKAMAAASP